MAEDATMTAASWAAETGFEELVGRFQTPLLRYVGRMLGPEEAQDVVQECFLQLHRNRESVMQNRIERISSWLFRVAYHRTIDVKRRQARAQKAHHTIVREQEFDEVSPLNGLEGAVRREACERALAELEQLPENMKHVLLLKILQGMSYQEIREVTGLSIGNIGYLVNQGLGRLARALKSAGII